MQRRHFLAASAALPLLGVAEASSSPARWPTKPITIIAPNAAGGPADLISRSISGAVSRELGVSVLVENRPGAAGKIGVQAMLNAPRDGHTIALTAMSVLCALPVFDPQVGYRSPEDFEPLTLATMAPAVLVAQPGLKVNTLAELIAMAAARPDGLTYGSYGEKSAVHLATEELLMMAGVRMVHVPFRGESVALTEMLGGRIDVMVMSGIAKPHIEAGRLVPLATTGVQRWEMLPSVPTVRESGVASLASYAWTGWTGFSAPAGIPEAVRARLAAALRKALSDKEASHPIHVAGLAPAVSTEAEMRELIRKTIASYRALAQAGRIKLD